MFTASLETVPLELKDKFHLQLGKTKVTVKNIYSDSVVELRWEVLLICMLYFTHTLHSSFHIKGKDLLLQSVGWFDLTIPLRIFSLQDIANCNRARRFAKNVCYSDIIITEKKVRFNGH